MTLFPRAELDTYAFDHSVDDNEVARSLEKLARLQHLQRAGYWSGLTEQTVEHSFVERVFADVFGYTTLLSSTGPSADHEVMPKLYVPLPGSKRAYPDFALGFSRADQAQTVVAAELKRPDADLDAPQSGGNYGGKTAVQQAMAAAAGAEAEWCIVSNTNEVRLHRVGDEANYERVFLFDIASPNDFRRAHALFSRRSCRAIRRGA